MIWLERNLATMKSVARWKGTPQKPSNDNENQIESWIAAAFLIPNFGLPYNPTVLLNSIATRISSTFCHVIHLFYCQFYCSVFEMVNCVRLSSNRPISIELISTPPYFVENLIISFISYFGWQCLPLKMLQLEYHFVFDIFTSFHVGWIGFFTFAH